MIRHLAASALAVALAGCVPNTEEPEPRGAAGYSLLPSDATRGVPFVTEDGFTVTIERAAIRCNVGATIGQGFTATLTSLRSPVDVFTSGIPEGRTTILFSLQARGSREGEDEWNLDVSPLDDARFSVKPETATEERNQFGDAIRPVLLLVLRAARGAESYRMNVTFAGRGVGDTVISVPVDVKRDTLTTVPLPVRIERLFSKSDAGSALRFASFATADRNKDGVIEGAELATAAPSKDEREDRGLFRLPDEATLSDLLRARIGSVFGEPTVPF
jgi:hypothetical protein